MNCKIKSLITVLILSCSLSCMAGGPDGVFKEWGGVTVEELKMKECSFEKDADAMLIYDLSEVYFDKGMNENDFRSGRFRITTAYYQRYKIFTENGTRKANRSATVDLTNSEDVTHIRAACYELVDGKIVKIELSPDDIHIQQLNEHEKEISFTVPRVSPGCVFEWGYEKTQGVTSTLPAWYFNTDVPSAYCRLTVGFVSCLRYYEDKHTFAGPIETSTAPFFSEIDVPAKYVDHYGGFKHLHGNAVSYTTHNLHTYVTEPFTNTPSNYLIWIGFQFAGYGDPYSHSSFYESFSDVSEHLYRSDVFVSGLEKNAIPKKELSALAPKGATADAKARAIYDYIRRNVKWNGTSGIHPVEVNATTWRNRAGSWSEMSMLLVAALRAAGVSAYPVLVGSRRNQYMNKVHPILEDYVGIDVLCILDDEGTVLLDPTETYLPFGQPAMDQVHTPGLVIEAADNCYWYDIEDNTKSAERITIDVTFDETGKITGTARLLYTGHSAQYLIRQKGVDNKDMIQAYLQAEMPGATIEESSDSSYAEQSSFVYRVRFAAQAPTDNDGNVFLSIATVYGDVTDPFVDTVRVADVDMAFAYQTSVAMTLHLPAGYVVDKTPAPVQAMMPDTSATFATSAEANDDVLQLSEQLIYHRYLYPVLTYRSFYRFQRQYYDLRQKPVMLRKKK